MSDGETSRDDLTRLLVVQDLDVRLDQLRHRERHHPIQAELAAIDAEREAHAARVAEVEAEQHELERRRKRLEDEVAVLGDRRREVESKLYDGSVTATKDLMALQEEIEVLDGRRTSLEDDELDIMEELEPVEARWEELDVTTREIDRRRAAKAEELEVALAEVRAEQGDVEPQRAEAAATIPAELLDRYEQLRTDLGGVAIARLQGATCDGCHLALSAVDADQIKKQPVDAVVHCPECGRILVR